MHTPKSPLLNVVASLNTAGLRNEFLVETLFRPGEATLRFWEIDRTVIGGIVPTEGEVALVTPADFRTPHFFDRREGGIINLGGPGSIVVDGTRLELAPLDTLYIGRGGARSVVFTSASAVAPARFYLSSYPAHASYPNRTIPFTEVKGDRLGARETANERTLFKIIHPGAFPTCQLVMGVTRLETGSVWNTMPAHTHLRRSEVYLYFNIPEGQAVFHFMGDPSETRHLVVRDGQAVLSPPWSIHSGAGTTAYAFVWGMGGENQEFADMDPAPVSKIL